LEGRSLLKSRFRSWHRIQGILIWAPRSVQMCRARVTMHVACVGTPEDPFWTCFETGGGGACCTNLRNPVSEALWPSLGGTGDRREPMQCSVQSRVLVRPRAAVPSWTAAHPLRSPAGRLSEEVSKLPRTRWCAAPIPIAAKPNTVFCCGRYVVFRPFTHRVPRNIRPRAFGK
jgi:hypothetical protein